MLEGCLALRGEHSVLGEGIPNAGGMLDAGEGIPDAGGMLDAGGGIPDAGGMLSQVQVTPCPPSPLCLMLGSPRSRSPPMSAPTPSPETRHAGSYRLSFIPENGGCLQKTRDPAPQK